MKTPEDQPVIINSPYEEPAKHWRVPEHEPAELIAGRRRAVYRAGKDGGEETELELVNRLRPLVQKWRAEAMRGEGGVSRITMELLNYWRREGRKQPLFFAQLEAAETIIFLTEARGDYLQGINIPADEPGERAKEAGYFAFRRLCCKLATGGGKTTVMAMLAAWNILNKTAARGDARYSDAILVVCPNITIRARLDELNPQRGEASIYRARDLVPPDLMPALSQGKVLTLNWHVLNSRSTQAGGRVLRAGQPMPPEKIKIGAKTQIVRGKQYMTKKDLRERVVRGRLEIIGEKRGKDGELLEAFVQSKKYIETDAALVRRVLGREFGGKQNILVMNDEAHHAYRLRENNSKESHDDFDFFGDTETAKEYYRKAMVWVNGLDKIHKLRKINYCLDFSATPYFLGKAAENTGRAFPWTVSDFGLSDAIESGLVKVPHFSVRTSDGGNSYYDLWNWILKKLKPGERGGKKTQAKPEAVLKYAHTPIALMAGDWEKTRREWEKDGEEERPPVFIIVCKNVKLAKVVYEWLAENKNPPAIPPSDIKTLQNKDNKTNTIRIDSKVSQEIESGRAKSLETQWMRFTLDTIGKTRWPRDAQNRPLYPPGFEELAEKLKRGKEPPGRDIRCIVSVSMLTEGWDCSTVTHIVGLRPFMSQLLCEQVVGRGLRRASYDADENGMFGEETAAVFGVPFRALGIPVKESGVKKTIARPHHIYAVPKKAEHAIMFPRVEGYRHEIRRKLTADFSAMPPLDINAHQIPPEVEIKGTVMDNHNVPSLHGPGKLDTLGLEEFYRQKRLQERQFELALALAKTLSDGGGCAIPPLMLFSQVLQIVRRYFAEKISASPPNNISDAFLSPYYGFIAETLREAIRPDAAAGETPELPRYEKNRACGNTAEVDYFTRREIYPATKSHLNAVVVANKLEKRAVYVFDKNSEVKSFVKNEQLGFAVPYFYGGEMHEFRPDFIVRLNNGEYLILETKGYDPRKEIKESAARRWTDAVNADNRRGKWHFAMVEKAEEIAAKIKNISEHMEQKL